jgi:ATP-dependent exoDNAse (exonuclease V) beta subunit
MTKLPDEAERIRALTDLASTLLVEAAAGTGKTSLLAGRVLCLLASGIPPREIAAITFTEFAAGELRERIARAISKRYYPGVCQRSCGSRFRMDRRESRAKRCRKPASGSTS